MQSGAVGGKLVGAGGGGFLMFYAHDRNKLRHAMSKAGLEEVRFRLAGYFRKGFENGMFGVQGLCLVLGKVV